MCSSLSGKISLYQVVFPFATSTEIIGDSPYLIIEKKLRYMRSSIKGCFFSFGLTIYAEMTYYSRECIDFASK